MKCYVMLCLLTTPSVPTTGTACIIIIIIMINFMEISELRTVPTIIIAHTLVAHLEILGFPLAGAF